MGRRFLIGTEAGFVGMAIGAIIGWFVTRGIDSRAPTPLLLAAGAPSVAGLILVGLVIAIPGLIRSDEDRLQPYRLPAIHVALTVMSARAMLTGPAPVVAYHEALAGVEAWFNPICWIALFMSEVIVLTVTGRLRQRHPA